ncbi:Gfo/Idh/MocA family oxidoreductase [Rhabdobacter roseus]|uniref:Putative dehydrogenase n=1 Tax=Rhabdobacter roseus TaxID=1655419 RepID=A0A840TS86_9BACT|nr:Gfo/Idh/MocA family oxidoreductase [Rhabdobacter roseus]MBB5282569.1 putative dehydrogenase [Rhabdobacter roseus]
MANRRDFLQILSLGAGLTALSRATSARAGVLSSLPKSDRQLRVALMGLGSYATRVAEAMESCQRAKLVGIVTGTPAKAEAWKKKYNIPDKNIYNYQTVSQLKNNPDIDAVYIITPNSLHHQHVMQVAAAGKHVICEKPLADTAKQAQEMITACEKAGMKLYVGYRLHFEPHTREVIRMREAGELGTILFVDNTCGFKIGDPTQWRLKKALAGGGALMDVGIYAINGARYGTGEEPLWVTAQEIKTDPVKFAEVDETITFQMGFPGGAIATCSTTYNFNNLGRLYVVGEKGFAELDPAFGYGPIKGRTHKGPLNQPVITHQTAQMDGLAECILDNKPDPNMTGHEALRDMKVIDAIYESIRKGGQKIMIG